MTGEEVIEKASNKRFSRAISVFNCLLTKYDLARKYNQELFHDRRHRGKVKKTDEYVFSTFHYPDFIFLNVYA